jgi:hypothetical protein
MTEAARALLALVGQGFDMVRTGHTRHCDHVYLVDGAALAELESLGLVTKKENHWNPGVYHLSRVQGVEIPAAAPERVERRGGSRPNTGRKPTTGVRSSRRVTVRLSVTAARLLPEICARRNLTPSDVLNQLISEAGERPRAATGGRRF